MSPADIHGFISVSVSKTQRRKVFIESWGVPAPLGPKQEVFRSTWCVRFTNRTDVLHVGDGLSLKLCSKGKWICVRTFQAACGSLRWMVSLCAPPDKTYDTASSLATDLNGVSETIGAQSSADLAVALSLFSVSQQQPSSWLHVSDFFGSSTSTNALVEVLKSMKFSPVVRNAYVFHGLKGFLDTVKRQWPPSDDVTSDLCFCELKPSETLCMENESAWCAIITTRTPAIKTMKLRLLFSSSEHRVTLRVDDEAIPTNGSYNSIFEPSETVAMMTTTLRHLLRTSICHGVRISEEKLADVTSTLLLHSILFCYDGSVLRSAGCSGIANLSAPSRLCTLCSALGSITRSVQDTGGVLATIRDENNRLSEQTARVSEDNKRLRRSLNRFDEIIEKSKADLDVARRQVQNLSNRLTVAVSKSVHDALCDLASCTLVEELIRRAQSGGSVSSFALHYIRSVLHNASKSKNQWRWRPEVISFFGNLLCRMGRNSYQFLSANISSPSISAIKRLHSQKCLDLAGDSDMAIRKLRALIDCDECRSNVVILQHDGIHLRGDVVWTKDDRFLGFVPPRRTMTHSLLSMSEPAGIQGVDSAEVYMATAMYSSLKVVLYVDPCSPKAGAIDFMCTLQIILRRMDAQDLDVRGMSFDAAATTIKSIRLMQGMGIPKDVTSCGGDLHDTQCGQGNQFSNGPPSSDELICMEQSNLRQGSAMLACQRHIVPPVLEEEVIKAHETMPVYLINPYNGSPIYLLGDPAHLLKRYRKILYAGNARGLYNGNLVKLDWKYIRLLRMSDADQAARGLNEEQPLLSDSCVQLDNWAKMSIPKVLSVYNAKVIGALEYRAAQSTNVSDKLEMLALAKHLKIGRGYFDIMRSKKLCILSRKRVSQRIASITCDTMEVLRKISQYYQALIDHGGPTGKSTVWSEIVSAICATLCMISCEGKTIPANRHIWLSRLSTDPLESLFGFVRQRNGGNTNPNLYQLVISIEKHLCKMETGHACAARKGNVENNRAVSLLKEISETMVYSRNMEEHTIGEKYRAAFNTRVHQGIVAKLRAAVYSRSSSIVSHEFLPLLSRQVNARLVGAVLASHRQVLFSKLNKLGDVCHEVVDLLSSGNKNRYNEIEEDLRKCHTWAMRRENIPHNSRVYDLTKAMDMHDGLVYPCPALVLFFEKLLIIRVLLFEEAKKDLQYLEKLPTLLIELLSGEVPVNLAKSYGLMSAEFKSKSLLHYEPTHETGTSEKDNHTDCDLQQDPDTSDKDSSARIIAALVKRYVHTSCRVIERTINLISTDKTFEASTGAKNVTLRHSVALKCSKSIRND